jgi:glucokinase
MKTVLAADIGGTKTVLQLTMENDYVLLEREYVSQQFESFDFILAEFLGQTQIKDYVVERACFAVAGPVSGRDANVTNLPWQLNADDIAKSFNIEHVHLCNDFEAVAQGIACLAENEIVTLQHGQVDETMPRAVIGAGTGLGQALLFPVANGWHIVSTEGGHTDFAPTDKKQILLLEHLIERFGHVSYERVLSGVGLATIYEFLRAYQQKNENSLLRQAMMVGDPAAAISQFANDRKDSLASESLDLFIQIYGAQAGNLALTVMPRGGLYIAGGIAAKNIERFKQGQFINAFVDKGRMQRLMKIIPVYLIIQPKVGLVGARLLARKIIV